MPLFGDWCKCSRKRTGKKRLFKFTEKPGGRASALATLPALMRSHYDDAARVAEDVAQLGYTKAALLLAERMPRSKRARSGELGEILATELVEENLGYRVPVRRLRYKDGREMALRGDDFIGIATDSNGQLGFAKGESKSRANLSKATIVEARTVLSRDNGRPTPTSILFVADRLMDRTDSDANLGREIRNETANKGIPPERIEYILFTVSGNAIPQALIDDLDAAAADRPHTAIHLQISDHQDFIMTSYVQALKIGNS